VNSEQLRDRLIRNNIQRNVESNQLIKENLQLKLCLRECGQALEQAVALLQTRLHGSTDSVPPILLEILTRISMVNQHFASQEQLSTSNPSNDLTSTVSPDVASSEEDVGQKRPIDTIIGSGIADVAPPLKKTVTEESCVLYPGVPAADDIYCVEIFPSGDNASSERQQASEVQDGSAMDTLAFAASMYSSTTNSAPGPAFPTTPVV